MAGHADGTVRHEADGSVAILTLDYPQRRNALSLTLRAVLADGLATALADPACRVIVLAGEGAHFCAGGDISGMEGLDPVGVRARLANAHRIVRMMVGGDKPVIAAVEGFAVGAGLSLVAACDIVVAAKDSRFACSFNRIGLVPDFGAAWTLPHRVGQGRARQIMLTGDTFGAEAALRYGLVENLAEPGAARADAVALAHRIASDAAPLANAFAKSLLSRLPAPLDDLLKAEADAQAILFTSRDFAEGRTAFLEKRKPSFSGA